MTYNPLIHQRRSIRLPDFDYSSAGLYFVTICSKNKDSFFGMVENTEMLLNRAGEIAAESWHWLAERYAHVDLDEWVIMPNHLHGILVISDDRRGGSRTAPTRHSHDGPKQKPLGGLVGAFKTVSTKKINKMQNTPGSTVWQRNYYEHVIRSEPSLNEIRGYIVNNPATWLSDKLFTES